MARTKAERQERQDVEFVDELPQKGLLADWYGILTEVSKHPGHWAIIFRAESPEQAWAASSNLKRRKIIIPYPKGDWEFVSRSGEVFAKFNGVKNSARIRRTK